MLASERSRTARAAMHVAPSGCADVLQCAGALEKARLEDDLRHVAARTQRTRRFRRIPSSSRSRTKNPPHTDGPVHPSEIPRSDRRSALGGGLSTARTSLARARRGASPCRARLLWSRGRSSRWGGPSRIRRGPGGRCRTVRRAPSTRSSTTTVPGALQARSAGSSTSVNATRAAAGARARRLTPP